jgi:SAM-dependent methyltransferase
MSEHGYYVGPELYDVLYDDVRFDIAPHVAIARAADGPVLEVCCGNGRLLVPTLEAGVDADGLDLDPAMLADPRRKLAARGLEAGVFEADMRDFTLPRRYAQLVIPFNSFLHNLAQDDQLATLRCCREHLLPGGELHLIVFHPAAEKLLAWAGGPKLLKEIPIAGDPRRLRVWDQARDDRIEQIRTVTRRMEWVTADDAVTDTRTVTFSLRYVFKPEMELLLRVAGFRRWEAGSAMMDHDAGASGGADPHPIREGDMLRWIAWRD